MSAPGETELDGARPGRRRVVAVARLGAAGVRAVRDHLRVVLALWLVQAGVAALFTVAVARTLTTLYGTRPLFDDGVAGDLVALALALRPHVGALVALAWVGALLVVGWALASCWLIAGLLGAFAGRSFAEEARARGPALLRLAAWALVPYGLGLALVGPALGRALDVSHVAPSAAALAGPLVAVVPGALLLWVTACAVDHARARLVATRGRTAWRALAAGYARVLGRRAPLGLAAWYGAAWLAIGGLYVAATLGRAWDGAVAGALLVLLRLAVALARFVARAALSGAQLALELEVLEVRELVERAEAPRDLGHREGPQPVEGEVLDTE